MSKRSSVADNIVFKKCILISDLPVFFASVHLETRMGVMRVSDLETARFRSKIGSAYAALPVPFDRLIEKGLVVFVAENSLQTACKGSSSQ
jgi:hypothetical protein